MASDDEEEARRLIEDSGRNIGPMDEPLGQHIQPGGAGNPFPGDDWELENSGDPNCKHYVLEPFVRIDGPAHQEVRRSGWLCKTCGLTILKVGS